jgi:hypothetical protein
MTNNNNNDDLKISPSTIFACTDFMTHGGFLLHNAEELHTRLTEIFEADPVYMDLVAKYEAAVQDAKDWKETHDYVTKEYDDFLTQEGYA